ncbi:uncharacterized protein C1orf53 homolog [Eucyclogobius newberryi]|uniref:uncharacterized protein C1orf53 homolog n=1 Tax=Eucyclogobius newberryi TaxID=166745 RepID=UPI003B599DCB
MLVPHRHFRTLIRAWTDLRVRESGRRASAVSVRRMSEERRSGGGGGASVARDGPGRDAIDTDTAEGGARDVTEEELVIHRLHREACEAQKQTYVDPGSGYKVFTEFAHRGRGRCCGSACRHCPFGQVNVKDATSKKTHNSLFYV